MISGIGAGWQEPFRCWSSENTAYVLGQIEDYQHDLFPEERQIITQAVLKRRREFSTGRYFARQALLALGYSPVEPITAVGRRPVWPPGFLGSISHSNMLAISVVCPEHSCAGIGTDIEETARVTPDLHRLILTEDEIQRLEGMPEEAALHFCAKEAVFKAVNPIVGLMIDFREIEIELHTKTGEFTATYIGKNAENQRINASSGHYDFLKDHVVAIFRLD